MTGQRLALAAVAALAAAGAARRRGSPKRSPETLPPLLQAEQDYLQRHRCVLAVYKQKTDASLPPHERLDQAFAGLAAAATIAARIGNNLAAALTAMTGALNGKEPLLRTHFTMALTGRAGARLAPRLGA